MSSAGHIMDMIQRMKQNRNLQRSKIERIRDHLEQLYSNKSTAHVPDTPFARPKPNRTLRYIHLIIFISIISIVAFFIYLILY